MSRIKRPAIPYRGPIYEGLHEGKRIKIKGHVPYGADRFTVNLQTGLDSNCDRPLHLSIRFVSNVVVRNTYQNRSWGEEERCGSFPFAVGNHFTLVIEVDKFAYKISVNGFHCWDYRHRIPYSKACSMVIDGDVSVQQIKYINKSSYSPAPVTPSAPVSLSGGILVPIPAIPYRGPICEGLHEGKRIKIKGQVPDGADRFTVNLQTGLDSNCDRPLHLSIRFRCNVVVRNTYQNRSWGEEERCGPFPFAVGNHFTLVIEVDKFVYKISVNGTQCWDYRHRIPYSRVCSMMIDGDVSVQQIEYINKSSYSPAPVTPAAPVSLSGGISGPIPAIPYRGPISEGLHEGKRIKIKGQVPYGADRFTVNLQAGLDSDCDRPLHLSIRFECNTVVRNTYQNRSWGEEERYGSFPFAEGNHFTLVIEVDRFAYKISVNGNHFWDYRHRIPYSRACSMVIDGDVSLQQIEYKNKSSYSLAPVTPSAPVSLSGEISKPIPYSLAPVTPSAPVSLSGEISGPIPTLPCTFPIYGGVRPGMSICINGRPTGNPQKFTVNIQSGTSTYPPADIAFHFDVRFFNYSIVRNTRVNGVWSSEETMISHSFFPFVPGANFDMTIKVEWDLYMIMLNGQYFLSFRHRLNAFPCFNVLSIENDVIVTSVKYI